MRTSLTLLLLLLSCGQPPPVRTVDASKSTAVASKLVAVADLSDSISITVTLLAADGAPMPNQPLAVTVSGTGNQLELNGRADVTTATSDERGQVVLNARSTVAEQKTVTFSSGDATLEAKPSITFVPGPLHGLVFRQQPTTVRAGQVMMPPVRIGAQDGRGNAIVTSDVTVSVRLVRSVAGVLTGGGARPFADGGVVFDMLSITPPQTGYVLRAETSGGGALESVAFDVTP
ncbi:MAG: Ig-like domain-containing protein [Myxococcaceae bacterium]|nr:Ig-like domain-containing protein [Myxococcaceae bacterium]